MGTATNQIATEKDLYYSGFTNFASSGTQGNMCVTYADLQNIKDQGFVDAVPQTPISIINPTSHQDSYSVSIAPQTYSTKTITKWDVSSLSGLDSVTLVDNQDGLFQVTVKNNGSSQIKAFLYLCFNEEAPQAGSTSSTNNVKYVKSVTINGSSSYTINSCLHAVLGLTTTGFVNKKTCQWELVLTNTSSLSGGSSSSVAVTQGMSNSGTYSSYLTIATRNSQKLVKYSSIGGKDNPVKVTWDVKITENVTAATNADTITIYYARGVHTNGTLQIDRYTLGTWSNGGSISGSASGTIQIDINPYSIEKNMPTYSDGVLYGSYLEINCGNTSKNQTWSYKLRERSTTSGNTGTWDTNYTLDNNSSTYSRIKVGDGYNVMMDVWGKRQPPTYSAEQFLKDIKKYNGIEFNVK